MRDMSLTPKVFFLLAALCVAAPLAAQERPPRDPKATRKADLVELVKLEPLL